MAGTLETLAHVEERRITEIKDMTNSMIANLVAVKMSQGLVETKVSEYAPVRKGYEHLQKFVISLEVGKTFVPMWITDGVNLYQVDPQFGNPRQHRFYSLLSESEWNPF